MSVSSALASSSFGQDMPISSGGPPLCPIIGGIPIGGMAPFMGGGMPGGIIGGGAGPPICLCGIGGGCGGGAAIGGGMPGGIPGGPPGGAAPGGGVGGGGGA